MDASNPGAPDRPGGLHPIFAGDFFRLASEMLDEEPGEAPLPEDFGPYRFIRWLGSGDLGDVYLAEEQGAERRVAVKILRGRSGLDLAAGEVRAHAQLEQESIARLYNYCLDGEGQQWLAMEYVEGLRLDQYCASRNCSIAERLRIFRRICLGVRYAHVERGVDHGDLKPSNILVRDNGDPRILDFGLSRRLSQSDSPSDNPVKGFTPAYAAPEIVRGESSRFQSDVYSLGVILYELLCGQQAFDDSRFTMLEVEDLKLGRKRIDPPSVMARRRVAGAPDPDSIGQGAWRDLDAICVRAMEPESSHRYASVDALLDDLDRYLGCRPLRARMPHTRRYILGKFLRRHRTASVAALVIFLFTAGMVTFFMVRLARERDHAQAEAARSRRIEQFMLTLLGASDDKAAPADDLRVVTLLDHGVEEAGQLGADPAAQSDLYENLGNMYDMLGEYPKAVKLLTLALDRRRQAPRSDAAETAEILVRLGLVRADAAQSPAQFSEAERTVRQGLDVLARHFPASDARVLSAQAALGRVVAESGDYPRAVALLQPMVARQPDGTQADYALSDSLSTTIGSDYDLGNIAAASALTSRALALDRRLYGPEHPQVALDYVDGGLNAAAVAHYKEAEPYYRQAIAMVTAWYGPNHPDTADYEGFLARALHEEGRLAQSQAILNGALQIQEHAYGDVDPRVAVTLDTIGEIQLDRGDLPGAAVTLARAVDIDRKVVGDGNYQTAIISADLGETWRREKQYARANTILAVSVKTLLATLPQGAFNTGIAQLSWGRTLLALKNYPDAATQLSAAYAIYKTQEHAPPAVLQAIAQDLLTAYTALNDSGKLEELRGELGAAAKPDR